MVSVDNILRHDVDFRKVFYIDLDSAFAEIAPPFKCPGGRLSYSSRDQEPSYDASAVQVSFQPPYIGCFPWYTRQLKECSSPDMSSLISDRNCSLGQNGHGIVLATCLRSHHWFYRISNYPTEVLPMPMLDNVGCERILLHDRTTSPDHNRPA